MHNFLQNDTLELTSEAIYEHESNEVLLDTGDIVSVKEVGKVITTVTKYGRDFKFRNDFVKGYFKKVSVSKTAS